MRERRVGLPPRGALATVLLALALLLEACSTTGSGVRVPGSPSGGGGNRRGDVVGERGDATTSRDAPGEPGQQQGDARASAAGIGAAVGALSSSDLGLVYQLILDRYVDEVDHAALVQAANGAVREVATRDGALPIDTAPLDFAPMPAGSPQRDWQNFARAYDAVSQKHPDRAAATRADWAALRRMLSSLGDNHSVFITPDEYRRMNESNYSGIGVRMSRPADNELPVIVEVFQSSPAARAGLKAGDRLAAVDGNLVDGRSLTEIVSGIRGPQGSPVKVTIARTGQPNQEVVMTRAPVEAPRVEGAIRGNVVGILRVRTFADGVPEAVEQVLTQGRNRGARAWVLDLRGNNGGALNAMARVAANFVENRPVGVAVNRAGIREPINAEGRPAIPRTPVVVLVDKETASGAEILAAALKEYQVGPIVGATTAGNVGIAEPHRLADGSAVQITTRRLVSPFGVQIDTVGVEPDVPVELTVADLERGHDPQLTRALDLLVGVLR